MRANVKSVSVPLGATVGLGLGLLLGLLSCGRSSLNRNINLSGSAHQEVLGRGRQVVALLQQQDTAALRALFSPELATSVSEQELDQLLRSLLATAPLGERLGDAARGVQLLPDIQHIYEAEHRWSEAEDLRIRLAFNPRGQLTQLLLTPVGRLPPSPYEGYRPHTRLRLPFAPEDTWYVFWGGPTRVQNYHVDAPDQRYAYDLIIVDDEGRSYQGSGLRNEQYYCWGRPILAPADATVAAAEDGVEDNLPLLQMNERQPSGNHVLLDFGHGEYGLFAHLRKGSVRVRPGQQVRVGELLGQCGNSGHSSEPHLHLHLQDGPTLFRAHGLPVTFTGYESNGQRLTEGTPVQGELLRNATP